MWLNLRLTCLTKLTVGSLQKITDKDNKNMRHTVIIKHLHRILPALSLLLCSACTTVEVANPDDPFESFNRSMYTFNDKLDTYALKPIAKGYKAVTPDIVDTGITNFFSNIDDIIVLVNDIFQLKLSQAASDTTRIVFNTFIGLGGLIDVSTEFGLPKHNEDFGQTLGYWGVSSGPYLVLPVFGSSNIRDAGGFTVDTIEFDPLANIPKKSERYQAIGLKYIDIRADLLSASNIVDETAIDRYAYIRDAWTQRRKNLVYDGNPPAGPSDEELFGDDLFKDDIKR
jgi:phospholipid-binding lipoprotein MlaA